MGIIYLIKNKLNNKCYVGQTIRTLQKRWKEHCDSNRKGSVINSVILKYSPDNFEITVIVETDNDKLDELEVKYIKEYNSLYPNGYNIQTGGNLNKKHCKESREKMRLSKLGEKNHNFGKHRSDETKKKISLSKIGKNHHFFGKELSYEHKLNLSKSHKKTTELPMYMVYLKERPKQYQDEGYSISNHPNGKNKTFTSKKLSLDEKYKLALNYLLELNSL
jgi:group I intron endonuclease